MLECKNIQLKAGDKLLFTADKLQFEKGLYALVGRNGTGKSTFLNALVGESQLTKGEIRIDGHLLQQISTNELAKKISVVSSTVKVFGEHTALEVLELGRLPYQGMMAKLHEEDEEIIAEVKQLLGISELENRIYNTLSDGEKQLVMIGRAMVQNTPIILMDEPAAFLDLVNRTELIAQLNKLVKEKNKLIIFSTHHIDILDKYCDGLLLIQNQELKCIEDNTVFKSEIEQAFHLKDL